MNHQSESEYDKIVKEIAIDDLPVYHSGSYKKEESRDDFSRDFSDIPYKI